MPRKKASKKSKKVLRTSIPKGRKRVPDEGRLVLVTDPWTQEEVIGTVMELLSVQFTYRDADGNTLFAFYNYPWEYL